LGANGTGTDAQDSSRERLKEMLASEDKPVAEGVAEMRQMEGIGWPARGVAATLLRRSPISDVVVAMVEYSLDFKNVPCTGEQALTNILAILEIG
jgi:hypothetical protein